MNKPATPIRAKVFANGNSRAVRIPSYIQPHIVAGDFVEVIIVKKKQPREGWETQFKKIVSQNPDVQVADEFGALSRHEAVGDGLQDLHEDWDEL